MISQLAVSEERRERLVDRASERASNSRFVPAALTVGAMFVAGFLLGRLRTADAPSWEVADARAKVADTTTSVADTTTSVRTSAASRIRDRTGTAEPESPAGGDATEPSTDRSLTEAEREQQREEAVALSPPTARGMPMLGVGTYDDATHDDCYASVREALRVGYRHVDTVEHRESYYNEAAVAEAIDDAGIAREDLFVATKVHPSDLAANHVRQSVDESLDRLGLDRLDLLYVHWPTDEYDPHDTLAAFADLREEGLIERIGVSNFTVDLLDEAIEASDAPIFANQVEMHPLLPQEDLREFCARDDVDVELVAYSPIARGDVEDVPALQAVAEKHDATPEQVSLAWLHEKGVTAIPRATTEEHLLDNWLSLDLELDEEDVARLDAIEERRRIVDRPDAPWNR